MATVLPTLINFCAGFGQGNDLASAYVEEKSTKRGEAHLLSISFSLDQLVSLSSLALKVFEVLGKGEVSTRTAVLCNVLPFAAVPVLITVEAVCEYEEFHKHWNERAPTRLQLPETLPKEVLQAARFFSRHFTDVVRVASAVALLALFRLGDRLYSLSALLAFTYGLAARNNFVSQKYRHLAETYFPAVSFVGGLLEGTLVNRLTTFATESIDFIPHIALPLQNGLDYCFKKTFSIKQPTFFEGQAPLSKPNDDLTFDQIEKIVKAKESDFCFSAPHLATNITSCLNFERTKDFSHVMPFFNSLGWEEEARQKMDSFMKVMNGEYRDGDPHDQTLAIENFEIIAAYLSTLNLANDRNEIESIFLELTINGGEYCSEKLHAVTERIILAIVERGKIFHDPVERYENILLLRLENIRREIVGNAYEMLVGTSWINWVPESITDNLHVKRSFRGLMSLGFAPIPLHERQELSLKDLFTAECLQAYYIKNKFINAYKLRILEPFQKAADGYESYIRNVLIKNSQLTEGQKGKMERSLDLDEVNGVACRLALYRLGVIRFANA